MQTEVRAELSVSLCPPEHVILVPGNKFLVSKFKRIARTYTHKLATKSNCGNPCKEHATLTSMVLSLTAFIKILLG